LNPKIEKITAEIEKTKSKLATYQTRLRDLERQKTEIENADILAMVRSIDVAPDEFAAFVKMFKAQQARQDGALPNVTETETALQDSGGHSTDNTTNFENDKEEI